MATIDVSEIINASTQQVYLFTLFNIKPKTLAAS